MDAQHATTTASLGGCKEDKNYGSTIQNRRNVFFLRCSLQRQFGMGNVRSCPGPRPKLVKVQNLQRTIEKHMLT
eukprot:1807090-Amphidinium_carterae.1